MSFNNLSIAFSLKEVTPLVVISLLKKILCSMNFDNEFLSWDFPHKAYFVKYENVIFVCMSL